MTPELTITNVMETPHLRAWLHRGESSRLVVCFSGIGPDPGIAPGYEFARSATCDGRDWVLYIADPNRTWLNGDGLIERIVALVEATAQELGATQVCALGHSMGGYSACILPGFMPVDAVVALSPQASVHPDVAADDPRWMNFRDLIASHRIRHVEDHIQAGTQYVVLFGQHRREAPQRDRFPVAENIETHHMARTHHNTAQRLKARGLLDQIIQLGFDRRIFRIRRLLRRNFAATLVSGRQEAAA